MRRSRPPALATRLMTTLLVGLNRESLIGDLVEQHQLGRSAIWYWRQAISAVVSGFAAEVWQHLWLAAAVIGLGVYLPDIYMAVVRPRWIAALEGWYPPQYQLATRIAYCVILAALARLLVRLNPRQRGMVVTLLMITQIVPYLPRVRHAVTDSLQRANSFWTVNLSYAIFVVIAIPVSILLGARRNRLI